MKRDTNICFKQITFFKKKDFLKTIHIFFLKIIFFFNLVLLHLNNHSNGPSWPIAAIIFCRTTIKLRNPSFLCSYQFMPHSLMQSRDTKFRRCVLRNLLMENLNILRIDFKHTFFVSMTQEITAMEFVFNKVAGCHLTKKGLHHSFFRVNFAKVFRSEIKYFSSFCSFTSVLTQNSILKNLFKSHQKKIESWGSFFREIAGFEVTGERTSY